MKFTVIFCFSDILKLHGPSMFAVKAKIYGVLYNQDSSIAFDETSSYWSALKSLITPPPPQLPSRPSSAREKVK